MKGRRKESKEGGTIELTDLMSSSLLELVLLCQTLWTVGVLFVVHQAVYDPDAV